MMPKRLLNCELPKEEDDHTRLMFFDMMDVL